jgi:hypothetical protein
MNIDTFVPVIHHLLEVLESRVHSRLLPSGATVCIHSCPLVQELKDETSGSQNAINSNLLTDCWEFLFLPHSGWPLSSAIHISMVRWRSILHEMMQHKPKCTNGYKHWVLISSPLDCMVHHWEKCLNWSGDFMNKSRVCPLFLAITTRLFARWLINLGLIPGGGKRFISSAQHPALLYIPQPSSNG